MPILPDAGVFGSAATFAQLGVASRASVVGGDFFAEVPRGDAYILSHIVHDWDDERAIRILRNIRRAIVPGGRLLLCETVVPGPGEESFAKLLDLEMLALPGGKERTEAEYRELLAAGGFRLRRIHPSDCPVGVVEAEPARV